MSDGAAAARLTAAATGRVSNHIVYRELAQCVFPAYGQSSFSPIE
jgi:hypothetical protein